MRTFESLFNCIIIIIMIIIISNKCDHGYGICNNVMVMYGSIIVLVLAKIE